MKKILTLVLTLNGLFAIAQVKQLPYTNQFANSTERSEMVSVRTGNTTHYDWSVSSIYASHDYPVGGNQSDTVSDWLFTPPLKVTGNSVLAFRYFVYGITGTATPSDEFSVWYGKSSKQPKNGTFVKIADLTQKVSNQLVWRDTSGIVLPFSADTGYVCFRYRATNNWFTLGVDSIVIKSNTSSIKTSGIESFQVYPNPAKDILHIEGQNDMLQIELLNSQMQVVQSVLPEHSHNAQLSLSIQSPGYYLLKIITLTGTYYRKIVVE